MPPYNDPARVSMGEIRAGPSVLYRSAFWRLGLCAGRCLPRPLLGGVSAMMAGAYAACRPRRREIVIGNLLPALADDRQAAIATARRLFGQFGWKLADLWRYESGRSIRELFGEFTGWEHIEGARADGRGILLVTIHLGNWEFGAPLLSERGIPLQVLTLAEPDSDLTELRRRSRARWGIETLVVGENPFGFVEVIRQLDQGAAVALLMDRPPAASAVTVELFGRPFPASVSAAELARASGCAILPVYLPRTDAGYAVCALPVVPYDRAELGTRAARQELTQRIIRAFQPVIQQYLDQWYHFVPVWPWQGQV